MKEKTRNICRHEKIRLQAATPAQNELQHREHMIELPEQNGKNKKPKRTFCILEQLPLMSVFGGVGVPFGSEDRWIGELEGPQTLGSLLMSPQCTHAASYIFFMHWLGC